MLFGGIANSIFTGLINLITGFMSIVMIPINFIISSTLPDLQNALNAMSGYIDIVGDYVSFCLSYLGFYSDVIAIACLLLSAIVMIPFLVHGLKLILRWYRILMP